MYNRVCEESAHFLLTRTGIDVGAASPGGAKWNHCHGTDGYSNTFCLDLDSKNKNFIFQEKQFVKNVKAKHFGQSYLYN